MSAIVEEPIAGRPMPSNNSKIDNKINGDNKNYHDQHQHQHQHQHLQNKNNNKQRKSQPCSNQIMSSEQQEKIFYGPYQHLKKQMDYDYHSYYRRERQWLHDSIIEDYLCHEEQAKNMVPVEPWLIYTCGVKGAGKRYVVQNLMEDGRLPLLSTIIVDADEIRRYLPEFNSLVNNNNNNNNDNNNNDSTSNSPEEELMLETTRMMNKEAGYIGELLMLAALQAGDNVILDGRLRNVEFRRQQFQKLRRKHPKLRIALFHITAPLDVIMDRVEARAKETGYYIPMEHTKQSLESLPDKVESIRPEVDYFCTIDNSGNGPFIVHNENGTVSWESFTKTFTQQVEVAKILPVPPTVGMSLDNKTPLPPEQPPSTPLKKNSLPANVRNNNNNNTTIPGRQCARRTASAEETRFCANSCRLRRRSLRRPFRVNKSTEENYGVDDRNFYGKYSHIRETLDYSYHSNYNEQRQRFQDSIITEFLHSAVIEDKDGQICTTPTEPWLVFTAGAMGAGKSYTMRKLVENGRFPLIAFITVDPDQIRRHLPEFHMYVDHKPELAGELTHKEAGFIAEILTLAGLQAGKNVMVDGSLRNAEWYKLYFQRLRADFPVLRIGIIHVTASREAILERAAERALVTGRVVPQETLLAAIEQVPKSIKVIGPLADYFVELINDRGTADIELGTEGETWENFSSKWIQACAWVPGSKKKEKLKIKKSTSTTGLA